jgi:hypothetical protein
VSESTVLLDRISEPSSLKYFTFIDERLLGANLMPGRTRAVWLLDRQVKDSVEFSPLDGEPFIQTANYLILRFIAVDVRRIGSSGTHIVDDSAACERVLHTVGTKLRNESLAPRM